jgi:hypothetical protein
MIERGPAALHADGNLAGERAVARVRQAPACSIEGGREIAAPRVDGAEHVVRCPPGRCGHAETVSNRWPGDQR